MRVGVECDDFFISRKLLEKKCAQGIEVNQETCKKLLDYKLTIEIAKEALQTEKRVSKKLYQQWKDDEDDLS